MKKFISVLLAILCLFAFASCSNDNKLYIAISPDYAPYEFVDATKNGDEKYVGSDVELAKYIAEKLGKELQIEAMGFSEALASVDSGKVDLSISGFTYTAERALNYEMSKSYHDEGDGDQVIITLKKNEEKFSTLEGLDDPSVKIGAQASAVQAIYVEEQLPNATLQLLDTINNGVLYLMEGKIDAMAISSEAAKSILSQSNYKDSIVICAEQFEVEESGLYVLAKKGNKELINQVNDVIDEVVEQGLYVKWLEEAQELFASLGDSAKEEDLTGKKTFIERVWVMFVENFGEFMKGLGITLALSLVSVLFAALLGAVLCLMNISKIKVLNVISSAYIEIIRGIPLLLQLTVIFLVLPAGMPKFITCVIALVINSGAYQAEIFRAGIQAVDKGQMEAARSLGMSYPQAMIKVILPQAIKNILPSLANEFVALIKETSLASTFYVGDLMTVKTIITAATYDALTPYVIIAIIYFMITFSLSKLIKYVEKKVAY